MFLGVSSVSSFLHRVQKEKRETKREDGMLRQPNRPRHLDSHVCFFVIVVCFIHFEIGVTKLVYVSNCQC